MRFKVEGRVLKTRPFAIPVFQFKLPWAFLGEYFPGQLRQGSAGQGVLHDVHGSLAVGPIHLLALDAQLQGALDVAKLDDLRSSHQTGRQAQ